MNKNKILLKKKKRKVDQIETFTGKHSFIILQLGNLTTDSWLKIKKDFFEYEIRSIKIKNNSVRILNANRLKEWDTRDYQSSILIIKVLKAKSYKFFINHILKTHKNLVFIKYIINEKTSYLPFTIKNTYSKLKTNTVTETLNLNILTVSTMMYTYLSLMAIKKRNSSVG